MLRRKAFQALGAARGSATMKINMRASLYAMRSLAVQARPDKRPIYLDSQATTVPDPRVLDAMLPYLVERYGNPHSRTHAYGWESEEATEKAREHVAQLLNADAKEIVFTSGATESNNIAIKGIAKFYQEKKKHLITTVTEHKCVLESFRKLQTEGFDVTYLPVKKNGLVDLNTLSNALRSDTSLVSVMSVNNEIGVIQPLTEIGKLCHERGAFFHTDAAQACGKIPMDVNAMNIDLLSLSGHKLYGPKGIGALYVRRKPRVRLDSIISGGGQERGIRSGTLAAHLIVGLGEACRIAKQEMPRDSEWMKNCWTLLWDGIQQKIPQVILNGDQVHRYYGNLNVSFSFVEGESLLMALKDVACSSGSACTSASLEPSYVLRALGLDDDLAHSSLRFGFSRYTTEEEIRLTLDLLVSQVQRLRDMSPLWEMHLDGIDYKTIQWTSH